MYSVSEVYQPIGIFLKDGTLVMGSTFKKLQSCSWMRIDQGHTWWTEGIEWCWKEVGSDSSMVKAEKARRGSPNR